MRLRASAPRRLRSGGASAGVPAGRVSDNHVPSIVWLSASTAFSGATIDCRSPWAWTVAVPVTGQVLLPEQAQDNARLVQRRGCSSGYLAIGGLPGDSGRAAFEEHDVRVDGDPLHAQHSCLGTGRGETCSSRMVLAAVNLTFEVGR